MKKRMLKQIGVIAMSAVLAMPTTGVYAMDVQNVEQVSSVATDIQQEDVTTVTIASEKARATKQPAKLSKADFQYKTNNLDYNLIDDWNKPWWITDWNYLQFNREDPTYEKIRTKRGITINSTASAVIKKYGKTAKKKINTKEPFYQDFAYEEQRFSLNTVRNWQYYYEYTYKKGGTYQIRFYMDKNNKVAEIVYLKNISKLKCSTKKKICPKFQVPEGKDTTTKEIDGNTITIIPKGTKLILSKSLIKKPYNAYGFWICQYDKNGNVIARTDVERFRERVSTKNEIDILKEIKAHCYQWNTKKRSQKGDKKAVIGKKDTYFAISVARVIQYDPDGADMDDPHINAVTDFAPEVLYFQYQ